ncbi:hypothetical protein DNTS_002084 [Danionella cerebrum]|uniref:Uncharacterized protein n=1 Tax=Danionella cerebrum TaxID=2873325 RepID=A0A553MZ75_9TELE|nr:hypothetical protein DNTS_002084 [Danionella translucida]
MVLNSTDRVVKSSHMVAERDALNKAEQVEVVMQHDFGAMAQSFPGFFRKDETMRLFKSPLTVGFLQESPQSESKSFHLETVTPPLRLIDSLAFIGHVSHIKIPMYSRKQR